MTMGSKEHSDILNEFEKLYCYCRLDREINKDLWRKGQVYESGETNNLYKAFIAGYSLGRCVYI